MAKIDMLADVAERLAEYRMFYPDTTITRVGLADCNSISHKDGLELSKQVCHMTHSGLLQFKVYKNRMYIFKSREFLKVVDGFMMAAFLLSGPRIATPTASWSATPSRYIGGR